MASFNLSLQKSCFPEKIEIAQVCLSIASINKADDVNDKGNYRPVSVPPCFSKILERIMYNRFFKYLTTNDILYKKQFGFQKGYSTEHVIIQLIDQINNRFQKKSFNIRSPYWPF